RTMEPMSRTGNLPGKNIRALIPDFLEARSHKIRTKASRTGYRERLSLLADFLDNPPVNRVTEDDLVRFCGAGKAVQSQLARRTAVRSFFSWAYRAGLVTVDPAAHLNDVFDVKVKNSRKAT